MRHFPDHQPAEQRVHAALRFRPLGRLLFHWVLRHARARVRDRENLRFERTRLFGRVRRIFVELGRRLPVLDITAVRDETAAFPVITGPRTLFEVATSVARFTLSYRHRTRRWTIESLDEVARAA